MHSLEINGEESRGQPANPTRNFFFKTVCKLSFKILTVLLLLAVQYDSVPIVVRAAEVDSKGFIVL